MPINLKTEERVNGKLYVICIYNFDGIYSKEKRMEIDASAHPRAIIYAIRALLRAVEKDYITHEICLPN